MKSTNRIVGGIVALVMAGAWTTPALSAETKSGGTAKGETSQQKSQQGLGLEGSGSSGVIMGGPEIIIGKIASIQGEEFAIEGDRGQNIRLRVTKDTNMVCGTGQDAKLTRNREGANESDEAKSSGTGEQSQPSESGADQKRAALNDPNKAQAENQQGAPTKDPSTLKDVVGTTDEKANKDVAHGSGFLVGGSSGCQFKAGDMVRVEASDMGTATTVQSMSSGERSKIAGRENEQPQ